MLHLWSIIPSLTNFPLFLTLAHSNSFLPGAKGPFSEAAQDLSHYFGGFIVPSCIISTLMLIQLADKRKKKKKSEMS